MDDHTRYKLINAVTAYDRRQSTRKGYNRFALGMYMGSVNRIVEEVNAGESLRVAATHNFCGRLLDVVLRAIDEPVSSRDEQRAMRAF